jgi:hypothetical protein
VWPDGYLVGFVAVLGIPPAGVVEVVVEPVSVVF